MKKILLYSFTIFSSIFLFSSCLMEEPDDIYKINIDGGGGSSQSVDFYANTTSIEVGGTVYFTNTSNSTYDFFYWTFGDGNYSYNENPSHSYSMEGTYDVTLYASVDNENDSETKYGYINVSYGGGGNTYCESYGGTSFEWLASVSIGGYSNYSGNDGGYGDYTNEYIYLDQDNYIYVELIPGYASSAYTEYFQIWIDYNNDGDFDDNGELITQGYGSSTVSGEVYIGYGVGSTRMRISMSDGQYRGPCETFSYGEVEDYTVVFNGKKTSNGDINGVKKPLLLKPKNGDYTIKSR